MRKWVAIGICIVSAAIGVYSIYTGSRVWLTVGLIGGAWHFTAEWLGNRLGLLHKSFGGIHQETKRGSALSIPLPAVARTMSRAASILMLGSIASCFFIK